MTERLQPRSGLACILLYVLFGTTLPLWAQPAAPDTGKATTTATGFFVTEDGFLVTSGRLVKDAARIRLVTAAGSFAAKTIRVDTTNDLALLKAEGTFTPLSVATDHAVQPGSAVVIVGFSNAQTFTPKAIKAEIVDMNGPTNDARFFHVTGPALTANSGGPLFDQRGNVVGVVSTSPNPAPRPDAPASEPANYAVKSSVLFKFLSSVPAVMAQRRDPLSRRQEFDALAQAAEATAVLVLVYRSADL